MTNNYNYLVDLQMLFLIDSKLLISNYQWIMNGMEMSVSQVLVLVKSGKCNCEHKVCAFYFFGTLNVRGFVLVLCKMAERLLH